MTGLAAASPALTASCLQRPAFRPRFTDELAEGEAEGSPACRFPDLDEGAHGLNAAAKNSGTGALRDHASHQIPLATSHHLVASLAFDPLAKSSVGLAGLIGGSAFIGPAAGLAMHAGWHEAKKAREDQKKFKVREQDLLRESTIDRRLSPQARRQLQAVIDSFGTAATGRIIENEALARASEIGGLIGRYSFLSGAAIIARVIVELIRNVGGAAANGTTNVKEAAKQGRLSPSFLIGTGLASNALAVAASGFAVLLGIHFVRKTGTLRKKWQADAPRLIEKRRLLADPASTYGRFLEEKGNARLRFANEFELKNRFFLAGTTLYAAGTILPTCVKLLAAAGVLSSKKVGAGLILAFFAIGIAGALTMAAFSHQFFFGHPKLERYEEYRLKDKQGLDRRFLTNIDTFVFKDESGNDLSERYSVEKGLAMREAAFDCMHRCNAANSALLTSIAKKCDRDFTALPHIGDVDYRGPISLHLVVKEYFNRRRLRQEDVEKWLARSENQKSVTLFFQKITAEKTLFLRGKEALHKRMHDQVLQGVKDDDDFKGRKEFAEAMFGSYDDTKRLLDTRFAAEKKLRTPESDAAKTGGTTNQNAFFENVRDFLSLNAVEEEPKAQERGEEGRPVVRRLAQYLFTDLPAQYNHDRGKLLEIEAQSSRRTPAGHRPILIGARR